MYMHLYMHFFSGFKTHIHTKLKYVNFTLYMYVIYIEFYFYIQYTCITVYQTDFHYK